MKILHFIILSLICSIFCQSLITRDTGEITTQSSPLKTEEMYDILPIYSCPGPKEGVPIPVWYGSCRDACSLNQSSTSAEISIFIRNDTIGEINVRVVHGDYIRYSTHEDFLGTCSKEYRSVPGSELKESTINSHYQRIIKEARNVGDQLKIEEGGYPECSYLDDYESYGWMLYVHVMRIPLKIDSNNIPYIIDPKSGMYYPYYDKLGRGDSGYWLVWEIEQFDRKPCYFMPVGSESCTIFNESNLISCAKMGVAFSSHIERIIPSTCVGDLNVSTDGILFQLNQVSTSKPVEDELMRLWRSSDDAHLKELIQLMNSALTSMERAYCENSCDVLDSLFEQLVEHTVMETPIGPWLQIRNQGESKVIPCKVNPNFTLVQPLRLCPDGKLQVIHVVSNDISWWDPMTTYVDPFSNCSQADFKNTLMEHKMMNKSPIMIEFWRGTATIEYPYNQSIYWLKAPGPRTHRSSKWFPQVKMTSGRSPIYLFDLNQHLLKCSQKIYEHLGQQNNTTNKSVLSDFLTKTMTAGGELFSDIYNLCSSIWEHVRSTIKLMHVVVILLLVFCVILATNYVLGSLRSLYVMLGDKNNPVKRRQNIRGRDIGVEDQGSLLIAGR